MTAAGVREGDNFEDTPWKLNNNLGFLFYWILYAPDHFALSPAPTADAEQYNTDLPAAPLMR
jgi:hypothetical protein